MVPTESAEPLMPNPGEHADVLRVLGRFLEEEHASRVEIMNHDAFLSVSWDRPQQGATERAYMEHELVTLRENAHQMREGLARGNPGGSFAELLRTLGQEIDREGVSIAGIDQDAEGFVVSGTRGGKYFKEKYRTDDLLQLSAQRRAERSFARSALAWMWMKPGLPIYAQDHVRTGVVKE